MMEDKEFGDKLRKLLPRELSTTIARYHGIPYQWVQPPPACRVYNDAAISIPDNTVTLLTFNQERYDTANIHSTASNTGRLTAPITGIYDIFGHIAYAANSTGTREILIRLNGATYIAVHDETGPSATLTHQQSISTHWLLNAGDYVELIAYQNSGGSLNVTSTSAYTPEFGMTWISNG